MMAASVVKEKVANGGPKDRQYVTALARGLKILRCFNHDRRELSPQEIVRLTGLPQPTVWRLCHTLHREGFIQCSVENGRMMLGLPALALGYAAHVQQALPEVALPYMRALTERHRLGISLAVRDGLQMLYLQRTHGDFIYFNDPVGARRPLALAPTGWACLSTYDDAERSEVLQALKRQMPTKWSDTLSRLERARQDYRKHGCILSIGILHGQLNAVAVPIRSVKSGRVYGLSAAGLATEWPKKQLLAVGAELTELARDLAVVAD